jgi:NAD(P)-dependent dehydrogenase (short-subunit alcohol dehydrogenase family)
VTGASRGIGWRWDGARNRGPRRAWPGPARRSAERQTDLPCDIADAHQVDRAVRRILTDHGVPDIVVNSAGSFLLKPVDQITTADFATSIAVNLTGPFLVARALLPHLRTRRAGHLVTIGSMADHVALPGNAAYAAAKYGVRGMHEVIAAELAGTGVRTTLVSPGPVDTRWDPWTPTTSRALSGGRT